MNMQSRLSRRPRLLAFLLSTQVLPVLAQVTPGAAPPAEPAASAAASTTEAPTSSAPAGAASMGRVVITGESVGLRQTRANVKITAADLDSYPPGVSADKVLERVSGIQQGSSNPYGGDGFESTINMRGFGKDSIGFSIDGVPNGRTTLGGGSVPTRFFDSSNLGGVDVSQSAGIIGAPSNQALVGHINYLTQDPSRKFGFRGEAAAGTSEFWRAFGRIDTGEIYPGITSYLSVSRQDSKISYIDDPAGRNRRDHVDFKAVAKLPGDTVVKFFNGWNDRRETSGTNIVTLKQFATSPTNDGYTDTWTGVPGTDRNYREFKGNPRQDRFTYVDVATPLGQGLKLSAKVYDHAQDGVGKEAALGNAGFPGLDGKATSLYFRGNEYAMRRHGILGELTGKSSELVDWRIGAWYERYKRSQVRNWYPVINEAAGPDWSGIPDAVSEDKHWVNRTKMVYASNRSSFMDGRLKLDYGVTWLGNDVDYNAPIHDSRTGRFNFVNQARVNSGVLPKIGGVYALDNNSEVYAGYAKNAAGVTDATLEGGAAATLAAATTVREMDTADAYDIGYRLKGDNYVLGVQGFLIKSKETVAADIVGTLQSENVQQGRRIHGVEFTYNQRIGDWRLYGAYTLQHHRYVLSDKDAAGYPAKGFIRDGADLVGIANQNLFLEATWRPTEEIKIGLNGRFTSSRAGYYANPRVAGSGVDERLPAYALFGLRAAYTFKNNFSVGLNVENIGDKKYVSGIAPELMTSPSTVGRYFIGAPRSAVVWARIEL
jgi:outer membrane receptor protein involved in Fe transport